LVIKLSNGSDTGSAPNHVLSATDVPPEFAGRAVRCRRLAMVPVECIARGYLAGGGLDSYRATGTILDIPLPAGLAEGSRLPEPVFTPTTKAPAGQHDEPMTFAGVIAAVGADTAAQLRRISSLGLRVTVFGFWSQA
jgi:phosphoribosylaminoimidazole-succinocarboxamide synthase